MPYYENDHGEQLWYEDQGSGPTLVLLHGWCMSSAVWRFQFEQLCGSFRVIAPDLAGHGRSSQCVAVHSFENFAGDLAALVRSLELSDLLLAGWSLGAQVALQSFPLIRGNLAGLALICGTPRFTSSADFPYGLSLLEGEGMGYKIRRGVSRALRGFMTRMFAPGELDDPALAGQVNELLAKLTTPAAAVALNGLNELMNADMRDLLSAIDLPTLVINGDRDVICLPEASAYMADRIGGCERAVFEGCGHAPFLTRSREFNDCLVDFSRRICERGI